MAIFKAVYRMRVPDILVWQRNVVFELKQEPIFVVRTAQVMVFLGKNP